jgi:hypothetical protein
VSRCGKLRSHRRSDVYLASRNAASTSASIIQRTTAYPLGAAADAHRDLEARRTSGQIVLLA